MNTGYYISKKDYNTIINYAQAAYTNMKSEIGGMAICYQDKDGDWIVTDPVIVKQEVTSGTCDLDKDALADYYTKAGKKHDKKVFRFCWWHSHHNMGVFWSGTDIKGINEYSDGDLSFALVVNLKRENKFRISVWKPVTVHEDTTLEILGSKDKSIPKKITEEVKELCNNRSYSTYGKTSTYKRKQEDLDFDYGYGGYGGYGYGYGSYAESRINHGTGLTTSRSYLPSTLQIKERHLSYCHGKIVDWIEAMVDGKMTYEDYSREHNKANEELKKMNSPCMLVKIGLNEMDEDLEWADPSMWIVATNAEENETIVDLTKEKSNGVSTK